MFRVTTLESDSEEARKKDYSRDFFGRPASLTVSGQLEAEAYARGLGVAQNLSKANELYKKGIREACAFYGVAEADIDTYVTGLPELTALTQEKALYEIHMQQWIDLMDRPFEEFVQWRRSGTAGNEVPTLQVPEDATSKELIRRWEYSPEEMTANINAPKESPKIWEKLWFDL